MKINMRGAVGNSTSWFAKVNPSLKFIIIAALFIFYLFIHDLNMMIWSAFLFLILYFSVSRLPLRFSALLILLTFIVSLFSMSAMTFFGKGNHILFHSGLIRISTESLARGLMLAFRTFTFSLISLIFAATTQPVSFFYSLMQQIKLPVRYAYGCLAAFRMLPQMAEEFQTLRQAMQVRGLAKEKGGIAFYNRMKRYSLSLLAQSIRRAQRTAVAMEAKRFSMTGKRTFYYKIGWSYYDLLFVVSIFLILAAAFVLASRFPPTSFSNVFDSY